MLNKNKTVHFVGIGGIGMSGLAEILQNLEYRVTGSDQVSTNLTMRLKGMNVRVFLKHHRKHVVGAGLVVISSAISPDNIEVLEAKKRNIPVITRGDLLADLVRLKPRAIAVAGSHGKTTTTSMIASILDVADIHSTMIVGGVLRRKGRSANWGKGPYLVTETDEHDGSFLKLAPTINVVTNIDREHLAYYGSFHNIQKAFFEFIHKIPFYGFSVLCREDPRIRSMLKNISVPYVSYGLDSQSDIYPRKIKISKDVFNMQTQFDVFNNNKNLGKIGKMGSVQLKAIGEHNILNALASIAVSLGLGISFDTVKKGLSKFEGVERRLQIKKIAHGCLVIEDYAHHPTEIKATIRAVRLFEKKRLIVIFQPHLYSRTRDHREEFAKALAVADIVFITSIYPAREKPIRGVSARQIVRMILKKHPDKSVFYVRDKELLPDKVLNILEKDDIVLVMGAGNIYTVTDKLSRFLEIQGLSCT